VHHAKGLPDTNHLTVYVRIRIVLARSMLGMNRSLVGARQGRLLSLDEAARPARLAAGGVHWRDTGTDGPTSLSLEF